MLQPFSLIVNFIPGHVEYLGEHAFDQVVAKDRPLSDSPPVRRQLYLAVFTYPHQAVFRQPLKRLAKDGLVRVGKDGQIQLTPNGRGIAERTIFRHHLIERMLTEIFDMAWYEVHDEAERLEHAVSPAFEKKLVDKLGHKEVCPHGNGLMMRSDSERRKHGLCLLSE